MSSWVHTMNKLRVSAQAVARTLLRNFETVKPLTRDEAKRIQSALENSGVPNATTRLNATLGKIVLKAVTE